MVFLPLLIASFLDLFLLTTLSFLASVAGFRKRVVKSSNLSVEWCSVSSKNFLYCELVFQGKCQVYKISFYIFSLCASSH